MILMISLQEQGTTLLPNRPGDAQIVFAVW